jgi:hypothetical protein
MQAALTPSLVCTMCSRGSPDRFSAASATTEAGECSMNSATSLQGGGGKRGHGGIGGRLVRRTVGREREEEQQQQRRQRNPKAGAQQGLRPPLYPKTWLLCAAAA